MLGSPTKEQKNAIIDYVTREYSGYGIQPRIKGNILKLPVNSLTLSTIILNDLFNNFPSLIGNVPEPYSFVSSVFSWSNREHLVGPIEISK